MTHIPEILRQSIPIHNAHDFDPWQVDIERRIEEDLKKGELTCTAFPRSFLDWWVSKSLTKQEDIEDHDYQRAMWLVYRFRCLCDHIFLSGYVEDQGIMEPILGMDFQETPHRMLFHQMILKQPGMTISVEDPVTHTSMQVPIPLSDLDTRYKKRMILWPRGLFKTSAIIVEMVQSILNYPNIRICFLTGSDKLAKEQCRRLKDIFEKPSKMFQFLFPEFTLKSVLNKRTKQWEDVNPKMGDAHHFNVPCRTSRIFAQPTFSISTAKCVKSGAHFDLIFVDDLVNDQNYKNVKALQKCYQEYQDICPMMDPAGFMVLTGTRYSFGDTYERIQEQAKVEEKIMGKTIWKFSIRDCWSRGTCGCGHLDCMHDLNVNAQEPPCILCDCQGLLPDNTSGVLFPETRTFDGRSIGHSFEFLTGEKVRQGLEFFANQYENNPLAQGTQTFTKELIAAQTLFHVEQLPPYQQAETFAIADLAYIGQPNRDSSVIYVCRKFMGQIFVFDCVWGNWDSSQVAENMVSVILKHRPKMVYPEKFNGWEAYDTIIRAHALKRGLQIVPIEWLRGSQQENAKIARIGSIKGPLSERRLWLFASMEKFDVLIEQLTKWPKLGHHDDFADCLGQVVAAPTGYQLENLPVDETSLNWLHRLHQSMPLDESYYDNGAGTGFCC